MRYFANPSTPKVRDAMTAGLLGAIMTPKQGNRLPDSVEWCADNGCYGKDYPGDEGWLTWLEGFAYAADRCAFAVAPDVVADAAATLEWSLPFLPQIRDLGYSAAFVAQDGQEHLPVPWGSFDVLFIGGSTEWKLGPAARELVAEAKRRGKPVHMGRVNSRRRYLYADLIGCDSADGTYIAHGPDKNLSTALGWTFTLEAS
jgi:hypothetical protein